MVHLLVFASGLAALTWELLWQHHAALATGVSAFGTALTLTVTMGGFSLGALAMGQALRRRTLVRPLWTFAALEVVVGLAGALLPQSFALVSRLDAAAFRAAPALAPAAQVAGIVLVLAAPALAMGATLPVLRVIADRRGASLAALYGVNTAGAAAGVLVAAFVLLPALGVAATGAAISTLDLVVALAAFLMVEPVPADQGARSSTLAAKAAAGARGFPSDALWLVFVTGLATFLLEVAWFRSLRAAFQSTTDSFAIVLAAVLLPLAAGARLATALPRRPQVTGWVLAAAGCLALASTPIVERMDTLAYGAAGFSGLVARRLGLALLVMGPAVLLLGVVLPRALDDEHDARAVGRLYGVNTLGAVVGALGAAWILLPAWGAARAGWAAGGLCVAAAAIHLGRVAGPRAALTAVGVGVLALVVAVGGESGVGRERAQGTHLRGEHSLLFSDEGPDATVSVVARADVRELVIDGFQTSGEAAEGHYMAWMGRLPMLRHPRPRRALVICFGTGQTARGVLDEGPGAIDVVELSAAVIAAAPLFASNGGVLADPRVRTVMMDGRAWLRRTDARYDVATLEPMAPYFAGTNGLYSVEFYRLLAARMEPGGVVAQWLPLHLVAPEDAAAVARTFQEVFSDARLWIDPLDRTGILLGLVEPAAGAGDGWPGLERSAPGRDLAPGDVRGALALDPAGLARYAAFGGLVTDDNQRLAYGRGRREVWNRRGHDFVHRANLDVIAKVARGESP